MESNRLCFNRKRLASGNRLVNGITLVYYGTMTRDWSEPIGGFICVCVCAWSQFSFPSCFDHGSIWSFFAFYCYYFYHWLMIKPSISQPQTGFHLPLITAFVPHESDYHHSCPQTTCFGKWSVITVNAASDRILLHHPFDGQLSGMRLQMASAGISWWELAFLSISTVTSDHVLLDRPSCRRPNRTWLSVVSVSVRRNGNFCPFPSAPAITSHLVIHDPRCRHQWWEWAFPLFSATRAAALDHIPLGLPSHGRARAMR